jgi:hypothetical protein
VIALACERPADSGVPLGRYSIADITELILEREIVPVISTSTVHRWLHELAIKPWQVRSWIFPRDPEFEVKATRVLDLYEGYWDGKPLGPRDVVLSLDEKTCIQALRRRQVAAPSVNHGVLVDSEYVRMGTVAYLASLDVFTGKVSGKVVPKTGIVPFDCFVDELMAEEPCRSANRVFFIVDNGASHQPQTFQSRLSARYPNAIAVHLPVHASWLNQIEAYFSILQRKALTPNDFKDTDALTQRITDFQKRYNRKARRFKWRFTKADLAKRLQRVS